MCEIFVFDKFPPCLVLSCLVEYMPIYIRQLSNSHRPHSLGWKLKIKLLIFLYLKINAFYQHFFITPIQFIVIIVTVIQKQP